ncbi:MAG: exo-alpha-sialidase [Anaerolineae bacterium]|nr:exo-alpha-sialidase [Anaerolineae bacterium]
MFKRQVKYQPERTRTFLGSPSVIRLPDGALIVSHDYFGKGCPRNHENEESLTSIYRSEDNGSSWQNITHIMNCYWSTLFVHNGSLYILGCSQQYGSIFIRRSDDGGFTWTHPQDEKTGILFRGSPFWNPPSYHCAPVAVTIHNGRIYKAFEDCDPTIWGIGFQACVISAPLDADLIDAASWTMSNKVKFSPDWMNLHPEWGEARIPGWREGNVVADPDGQLWDILTFEAAPFPHEKAARIKILDDGKRLEFDPVTGFFDFPGSKAKFTLRRDPVTGKYLSIVNNLESIELLHQMANAPSGPSTRLHMKHPYRQRNFATLTTSDDLWNWRKVKTLVQDDSGLSPEDSLRLTGFQYTDWIIDGDNLIFVVRTAHRGAQNFHDSNQILFFVLENFRQLL